MMEMGLHQYTTEDKLRVLKKARALIRKGWMKDALSRSIYAPDDKFLRSPLKTRYCAVGAINEAACQLGFEEKGLAPGMPLLRGWYVLPTTMSVLAIVKKRGFSSVSEFNDWEPMTGWAEEKRGKATTKKDVVSVFDERIAELEAELAAEKS
jgi:hypothetical protein